MPLSPLKLDPKTRALADQNGHCENTAPLDTGTVQIQELPFPPPNAGDLQLNPLLQTVGELPNTPLESPNLVMNNHHHNGITDNDGAQSFRSYEQKTASSSSHKYQSGNFSREKASAKAAETKKIQSGDVRYEEKATSLALREKVETDGITAEKMAALKEEQK